MATRYAFRKFPNVWGSGVRASCLGVYIGREEARRVTFPANWWTFGNSTSRAHGSVARGVGEGGKAYVAAIARVCPWDFGSGMLMVDCECAEMVCNDQSSLVFICMLKYFKFHTL